MRSVLALFFAWLMPSTGRRRACETQPTQPAPTQHTPAVFPMRRLLITRKPIGVGLGSPRSLREPDYLCGEDVKLIRPYYARHIQEQERLLQRDRRTALLLAAVGIDFQGVPA
ncbi:hypothetical protein HHL19_00260 [Streptomyces sp. R302]|uniref:hypothetical protein n=1 Tax=unclassified Streptomyces TaxID=2593676 RepID=UPI00145EC555|nr:MULTISPECIES: hypothetical protein [unclassified Streptomyces]NML48807.1 hypothetical protein [Streptomyces sp. R301]NML77134.1 hypothetical protein [Streptomyces sp. R302]